jgi:RNA polymerase sigma-70 factor (ECF subfamily)
MSIISPALATLMPTLLPRLWTFAVRLTGNMRDAEHLVHSACVWAIDRDDQMPLGTSPISWMFSVLISVWTARSGGMYLPRLAPAQTQVASCPMGVSSPVPETQQPYPRVVKAVDQLPDAERLVVLLVLLDQFSCTEAAKILGISLADLSYRLCRANDMMASYLTRCSEARRAFAAV